MTLESPNVRNSTDPQDAEHGPHNEQRAEGSEITGLTNLVFKDNLSRGK